MLGSIAQNKALTLLVLIFFPLTLSLGFWQLDRAKDKQALIAQTKQTEIVQTISTATELSALEDFQTIAMQAHIVPDYIWLLDNQVVEGKAGIDVIVPVQIKNRWLLVNLGWQAWPNRSIKPKVLVPQGKLYMQGRLVPKRTSQFVLQEQVATEKYPKLIQRIDIPTFNQQEPNTVWPYVMYLNEESDGVLTPHWKPINMTPAKHYGYAVQWFGLALVLLVLYVVQMVRTKNTH